MSITGSIKNQSAQEQFDKEIAEFQDWRGVTLHRIRDFIMEADPDVVEECKWFKPSNPTGVPIWSHARIICTGESYKSKVKLTFFKEPPYRILLNCLIPASKANNGVR